MRAGIVVAAALAAPAPASADFHGACDPDGVADVGMSHSGGTFAYRGFVQCGTATSIEITSLTLTRPDATQDAGTPASCGPCDGLETAGDDPAGATGTYRVRMVFTVRVGGQTFANRTRQRDFTWDGTRLTGVSGTPPAINLCDASQPRSATVGLASDPANAAAPLNYTWSGALVCHGVDELRITELAVQRRGGAGDGPVRRADVTSARCLGCIGVSAAGTRLTEGPGTYRVTMRYTVRKGTDTRTNGFVQRDVFWLGAGPVVP
jgi:hypothetical protein